VKPAVLSVDRPAGIVGYTLHYGREAFRLLFLNGPAPDKAERKTSPTVSLAVEELKAAADEDDDPDAMFLLAEMNFYGNFTHPRNFSAAFQWYNDLAWLTGNSTAQSMVGFMYATGIGDAVERDQAKALMYHEFAAEGGNTRSEMTLAYRYHTGIGTPKNCEHAVFYYKRVADKAIEYYRSGPPGGHAMVRESYRWADEEGGVYGEGASVSSSGHNARDPSHSATEASVEDVLEYLDLMSRKGELKATFTLGKMNYEGKHGLPRNFKKAMKYFRAVTKRYWNSDGSFVPNPSPGLDKLAAKAAGHIGLMYLRGEGVEQNLGHALTWFRRGVKNGDGLCQHEMGLMYLHGYGVPQDAYKAASYFKSAADQDIPAAETRIGALFLDQGDVAAASRYFELAARWGWMEAYYYLAEMANFGVGRQPHCGVAAAYYKMVAEKAEVIHSAFAESNAAYESGDKESALIPAMMAAEQGYEHAQANVAYLLDEQRSLFSLSRILPWAQKARTKLLRNTALALIYWTRSAKQSNIDSLIKMGDYYLRGTGALVDAEKASTCYHNAAEAHHSAQAYWNLGWMHENGVAVAQDFHMAKRYYDLALATNREAYLPVKLSLLKLRARGYWNRITKGDINPIRDEGKHMKLEGHFSFLFYTWLLTNFPFQKRDLVAPSKNGSRLSLKMMQPTITTSSTKLAKMTKTSWESNQTKVTDITTIWIWTSTIASWRVCSSLVWLRLCSCWCTSDSSSSEIARMRMRPTRVVMPMATQTPMPMRITMTVASSHSLVTRNSGSGWQVEWAIDERICNVWILIVDKCQLHYVLSIRYLKFPFILILILK
jgi:SEL1 protein